jgi:curved DNA-binding protein CbpA
MDSMDYYERLGVGSDCSFAVLKKAYYKRVMQCHPDRFGNDPAKAEEFRLLVEAFLTLSDGEKRKRYDLSRTANMYYTLLPEQEVIMDSEADDTLELLIVGNDPPKNTTVFTFFLDLEKTLVYMTGCEAKNLYEKRRYRAAVKLYTRLITLAPTNILYRVYLARCLAVLGDLRAASIQYKTAIAIGKRRDPAQHLFRVKKELKELNRKRIPFLAKLIKLFSAGTAPELPDPEQEMIRSAERVMAQMLNKEAEKRALHSGERNQLR